MSRRFFSVLLLLLWTPGLSAWDDERLATPVVVDGRTIPYKVFAIYVMPQQIIDVHLLDAQNGGRVTFNTTSGDIGQVVLRAPVEPGLSVMQIDFNGSDERATINVFTMVPATQVVDGHLDGYRIGAYPAKPFRGQDIYLPPNGFVRVTREVLTTPVSPNFKLGQFVAKQASGYPKYLVLRSNLLLKLENILATFNRNERAVTGFVVMSGFRTPFYNRSIGNGQNSRHIWGGAADFYIDDDGDGRMDDLNGDGRVDRADSVWLADFINGMSQRGAFGTRIGGLGVYGSTSSHGPFVHVDVRGSRARW